LLALTIILLQLARYSRHTAALLTTQLRLHLS